MNFATLIQKSGIKNLIPDKTYLSIKFRKHFGYWMDWDNPKTFNEKLQWLKVYDRQPWYVPFADKYEVKLIVEKIIGQEYVIPTYGVWNSFDEIDFNSLPQEFVLKCTHDSGSVIICKDKSNFNYESAREKLDKCLKFNSYLGGREWVYKDIKPRIIAEKYIKPSEGDDLKDFKFFCFDGVPKIMFIASNRFTKGVETTFDYFDMDFNHLSIINGHPNSPVTIEKPVTFDRMKELAGRLSQNFPHIRIDFYEVNDQIYFGEYTFYHFGGAMNFEPSIWDERIGSWLNLPAKNS